MISFNSSLSNFKTLSNVKSSTFIFSPSISTDAFFFPAPFSNPNFAANSSESFLYLALLSASALRVESFSTDACFCSCFFGLSLEEEDFCSGDRVGAVCWSSGARRVC